MMDKLRLGFEFCKQSRQKDLRQKDLKCRIAAAAVFFCRTSFCQLNESVERKIKSQEC